MPRVDGDILVADLGGAPIGGGDTLRARPVAHGGHISSSAHLRLIAVGRVAISVA